MADLAGFHFHGNDGDERRTKTLTNINNNPPPHATATVAKQQQQHRIVEIIIIIIVIIILFFANNLFGFLESIQIFLFGNNNNGLSVAAYRSWPRRSISLRRKSTSAWVTAAEEMMLRKKLGLWSRGW